MSSILADKLYFEKQINSTANRFFHSLGVRKLMQRSNFSKTKGIACFDIFSFMFSLVFTGKNLYRTVQMEGNTIPFAKDCVYRFLNNCHYNWKKFLLLLSQKAVNDHLSPLTSSDRVNVFIVDDSMFSRNRSKKVELLSRCKDHVGNRYIKGFRMLTLGWSDGHSFIPLAFSLLGSRDEKKQLCHVDSSIDKRTNGYQRRKEAIQKSTDALIHLLEQAKPYNFPVDYLLFDSWFSFPSVIVRVKDYGLNTICMLKDLPANRYEYQGQRVTLGQLYQQVDKKDCKKGVIATARVCLGTGENGCKVMARIAFIHDRSQRKQWLALLSTDTNLTDDEIIRIYGKRWDIEVFFKTVKSYLKLSKEYQGRSYDSMVAHTTIVFARYIMLSLESRSMSDPRSLGELFFYCCDEVKDITFIEALQRVLTVLKDFLHKLPLITEQMVQELMTQFIGFIPSYLKGDWAVFICES